MAFWITILISAAIIAIAALGLFLQIRSGQLNVGMAVFVGVGGYATGVLSLQFGLPPIVAVPLAIGLGFVVGAAFSALTLRLHHWFFAVTTLSLSVAAVSGVGRIPGLGGPLGLSGIPLVTSPAVVVVGFLCAIAVAFALDRSSVGLMVRGMGDDQVLAQIFGIKVHRLRVLIFGLGTAMGAASGALNALRYGVYQPGDLGFESSLMLFVYVIVGGKRNVFGPIVGVLMLYVLPEAIEFLPQARLIVFGLLMILCAVMMPEGIVGAVAALAARLRQRRSGRPGMGGRAPAAPRLVKHRTESVTAIKGR